MHVLPYSTYLHTYQAHGYCTYNVRADKGVVEYVWRYMWSGVEVRYVVYVCVCVRVSLSNPGGIA